MDSRLYTIREIARELALPESTVRYYRDAFSAFLPSVGTGRRRRYPAEAIPLLRLVAEGYAQNRPRPEIERALTEALGGAPTGKVPPSLALRGYGWDARRDEVLATVLEGERERREVMWQMARELVRLGEAVERQHILLTKLTDRLAVPERTLPASSTPPAPGQPTAVPAPAAFTTAQAGTPTASAPEPAEAAPAAAAPELAALQESAALPESAVPQESATLQELAALREELARERELVERLRRSKLEIERRAAEAEARLGRTIEEPGGAGGRGSRFSRLFFRGDDGR